MLSFKQSLSIERIAAFLVCITAFFARYTAFAVNPDVRLHIFCPMSPSMNPARGVRTYSLVAAKHSIRNSKKNFASERMHYELRFLNSRNENVVPCTVRIPFRLPIL